MTNTSTFVGQILAALPDPQPARRNVIAIAGPPTAGKSTLAATLLEHLGPAGGVLGMDAFHYDDAILNERGDRERKGAPHTFDVAGYAAFLERVRSTTGTDIAVPVFDRTLELTRNAAEILPATATTVITEGNWLLLDRPRWRDLQPLFDLTVMLDVAEEVVKVRSYERWHGFGFDDAAAEHWVETNDLPNARIVRDESRSADLTLS